MKYFITTLLIIAGTIQCFAQFNFRVNPTSTLSIDFNADTLKDSTHKVVLENERLFDSTYNICEDYDFQFRLDQSGFGNNARSVFIMTHKENKWSAKYLHFNRNWIKTGRELIEVKVDSSKLNQLWHLLDRQNILTLPNENKIVNYKTTEYLIDTFGFSNYGTVEKKMLVADGIGYSFKLLKPTKRRSYYYSNPDIYFKEYPYIKEYSDVVLILYLIRRYLGLQITQPL